MRIRTYFILFALLIAIHFVLVRFDFGLSLPLLITLWATLWVLTILFFFRFYWKIVKPLRSIENGMLLLNEQDFSTRLTPVGQYDVDRIIGVFNKMMSQLKGERLRVREQNQLLDLLIQVSPMGLLMLDLDRHISFMNPAAERMLGLKAAAARDKELGVFHQELPRELQTLEMDQTRTVRTGDSNVYRLSHHSFLDRGYRHSFYLIEQLTEEVMQAEKKAYEKVIRMMAHEVNNTVAGVTSTLDSLDMALKEMPDADELSEVMRLCIERCYGMSRFITNFADVVKIPDPVLSPVDLNKLVQENFCLMESLCCRRHITLRLALSESPVKVQMDAVLFQQALINMVKNAAESIGEEGIITISTSALTRSLEVTDTGKGIRKEDESKIFTPFFSTKPNGQGIGLMLIREVLMKHRCTFSLRTGGDGLTRFQVHFP